MAYTIVSVENDPQTAELLQIVLRRNELQVHFAHDGVSGLKLIRAIQPDLILLDVMLPEMNGWEIYDAIRADSALQQTPVIMVSVIAEVRERKQAFTSSEIDSYFTKPFDIRLLRVEIERVLDVTLWNMPDLPPRRDAGATEEYFPAVDPSALDDTQPMTPLKPMRGSRPAKRRSRPASHTQTDSSAQNGEASADT